MSRARPSRLEVRESAIAGRGLFALERIERCARIIEYTGERVASEEGERRHASTVPFHTFLFGLGNGRSIDAGVGGNNSRFINHACRPNCGAYIERGRIFIYARRVIAASRELFLDYAFDSDAAGEPDVRAACPCPMRRSSVPRRDAAGAKMTRVDRHLLITLAGLVILESTLGWTLKSVACVRTPLFVADMLVGMLLLAFALAIEPNDGPRG